MTKNVVHILRYGTVAEKKHLCKAKSAYDYLSINGNSAAFVSTAIAKLIVDNFLTNPEKGYFIDPITYAFQREINLLKSKKRDGTEDIKKSIKQLIQQYGEPSTNVLKNTPMQTNDFDDQGKRRAFCKRVLDFQYTLVTNHIKNNGLEKYVSYALDDDPTIEECLKPKFLIPPYFYLTADDVAFEKWLKLNQLFLNDALELAKTDFNNCPVFGQIVLGKDILSNITLIDLITTQYAHSACDGITLWVDDFSEHSASETELSGFIHLLETLKEKTVFNMYGGYFSILLTHKDIRLLNGVSHGLEYGESRKVYPVGGGVPVSKYYFFPLHQRLSFAESYGYLANTGIIDTKVSDWGISKGYFDTICRCGQCKEIIGDSMIDFLKFESRGFYEVHMKETTIRRKKATGDTKENCLYHYLLCKKQEFSMVAKRSINFLLKEIVCKQSLYEDCNIENAPDLSYLGKWNRQIGGVINEREE